MLWSFVPSRRLCEQLVAAPDLFGPLVAAFLLPQVCVCVGDCARFYMGPGGDGTWCVFFVYICISD